MDSDKRNEFIKSFAVQVKSLRDTKFYQESEKMQPTIGELADGYRSYIADLGEGFLQIAEDYNMCLEIAKQNELIGDVKLKARIKDFSSARINSDKKILDDVFGMEVVAPTEREKEILMLFSHLIFDISKNKKYNKSTGYKEYHCMGDFSPKNVKIREWIKDTVNEAETREYKCSNSGEPIYNRKNMVPIFPILKEYIKDSKKLREMSETFEEMKEYMETINSELALPVIETQFKTMEVEENAIRGTAAHSKYKPTDEKKIKDKFKDGQLIRGINSPWKFEGTSSGLKLQDFYKTLMENWPFLKGTIRERRNLGKEPRDREKVSVFDSLTASIFPFFRKYIPSARYDESKREEKWGALKVVMIVNGLDETGDLGKNIIPQIDHIWRDTSEQNGGGPSL